MTNPTKGQTPTGLLREAVETLQDAKEQIMHLTDMMSFKHIPSSVATNKGIDKLTENINTFLSSAPPPALTWEQAKQNVAGNHSCSTWNVLIRYAILKERIYIEDKRDLIVAYENEAAALMEANRLQRWIPVEERLPDEGEKILFATKNQVYAGSYIEIFGNKEFVCSTICCVGVVAWQPLPEVPKQ